MLEVLRGFWRGAQAGWAWLLRRRRTPTPAEVAARERLPIEAEVLERLVAASLCEMQSRLDRIPALTHARLQADRRPSLELAKGLGLAVTKLPAPERMRWVRTRS
jgi:hypothetical protein